MDEDDYIESDDLLYSQTYGIRMFYSGGIHQELIVGVVLEETDDSFLVALPVLAAIDGEKVMLEEVPKSAPYHRLLKSGFRMVSFPTELLEEAYMKYLRSVAPEEFPELLDMIDGLEEGPVLEVVGKAKRAESKAETIDSTKSTEAPVMTSPLTEKELKERVKKALDSGFLLSIQSNKPS